MIYAVFIAYIYIYICIHVALVILYDIILYYIISCLFDVEEAQQKSAGPTGERGEVGRSGRPIIL